MVFIANLKRTQLCALSCRKKQMGPLKATAPLSSKRRMLTSTPVANTTLGATCIIEVRYASRLHNLQLIPVAQQSTPGTLGSISNTWPMHCKADTVIETPGSPFLSSSCSFQNSNEVRHSTIYLSNVPASKLLMGNQTANKAIVKNPPWSPHKQCKRSTQTYRP
jgi:hypothetical protein